MTGLKVKKTIIILIDVNVLVHWPGQVGPILLPWIFMDLRHIPYLGLRCTNIPAPVTQANRAEVMITLAVPS